MVSSRKEKSLEAGPQFFFRNADIGDAQLLFDWRNDPLTVLNSKSRATVSPQEHAEWFESALKNENVVLLMAEKDNIPIAMTRFELKGVNSIDFVVSINLAPSQRGKGFGGKLLRMAILEFQSLRKANLIADIRHGNLASEKIFKSAGFVQTGVQGGFKQFVYLADCA